MLLEARSGDGTCNRGQVLQARYAVPLEAALVFVEVGAIHAVAPTDFRDIARVHIKIPVSS